MDWINKFVLEHVLHQPAVSLALVVVIARADHLIGALLKVFTPAQIDNVVETGAKAIEGEIAKVAAEQPKPGA